MPNRMIYINKVNVEQLDAEENKSGLINLLLWGYFKGKERGVDVLADGVVPVLMESEVVEANQEMCPRHHQPKSDCINLHK